MSRAVAFEQLLGVGSRGRLRRSVDRFPHFVADARLTGTEGWDNEVCWTSDDIEVADQTVAAVFYEDVEIIGRRQ